MPLGIMPGENDWMNKVSWGGLFGSAPPIGQAPVIPTATPPTGSWADKLVSRLNSPGAQLGLRILANNKRGNSLGNTLGQSFLGYQQDQAQQQQADLQRQLMQAQIQRMQQPQQEQVDAPVMVAGPDGKPRYVSRKDAIGQQPFIAPNSEGTPASLQEWEAFQRMNPEQQKQYLNLKRQPSAPQLTVINGVPTLVDRVNGTQTPLSSLQAEAAAQGTIAAGKATGQARGEAAGALEKKGINAKTVIQQLDLADPLIDAATGSTIGAGRDKLAAVFGEAPVGAQAIAQLQVLQAGLMLNMPRMEGPQSDRDTMLYREAAGQIGDPKVPREIKKAAVRTIRKLQEQYTGVESGGQKPKETAAERAKRLGL